MSNRLRKGEVLMTEAARDALDADARNLRAEIARLRAAVKQLGEMANICTFDTLKQVCDGCRCGNAS